uniref:DUF2958 domain-containing protein n=1 Tax=Steinernema glaseri TaxID=37863 RepID=A0A1I8ASN7_9BILA
MFHPNPRGTYGNVFFHTARAAAASPLNFGTSSPRRRRWVMSESLPRRRFAIAVVFDFELPLAVTQLGRRSAADIGLGAEMPMAVAVDTRLRCGRLSPR